MAQDPKYNYDVFLSYSRADEAWASKLFRDLEKKGVEPFFDKPKLMAGGEWDKDLLSSLRSSQHMIVLWSDNAEESSWVRREMGYFDGISNDPTSPASASDRRMIFICLENESKAYSNLQMITDLRDEGAYAKGPEQVDPNLWQLVLNKVYGAITSDSTSVPVPLIILTTTSKRLANLNTAEVPDDGDSLDTFLQHIGIGTKDDLLVYYDEQRADWKPFGNQYNIQSILDKLKDEVNGILNEVRIRWEPIGDDFWSNEIAKITREINKLATGLSVVILDPLALYDPGVAKRFNLLWDVLRQNEKSLILTLSPFTMPKPNTELRKLIMQMATTVYNHLYEPVPGPVTRYAHCDINIGDEMDIKRALLATMGKYIKKTEKPVNEYLRNRTNS